jgi:riboflavin synthase
MFTGIVEDQGAVVKTASRKGVIELEIAARRVASELKKGDSVAVNGVCLTATSVRRGRFTVQVTPETRVRTALGRLERGERVNLELPARLSDRLGGHIVQGHVDGVARVMRVEEEDGARRAWLSVGDEVLRYVVEKGSVALDGVSLTVAEVGPDDFQVALIPHTLSVTTLADLRPSDEVNVEVDVIAKYVERLALPDKRATGEGA